VGAGGSTPVDLLAQSIELVASDGEHHTYKISRHPITFYVKHIEVRYEFRYHGEPRVLDASLARVPTTAARHYRDRFPLAEKTVDTN
jgi:hypothetical protein